MIDKNLQIIRGYVPGIIEDIVRLNADYYNHRWHFNADFEAGMTQALTEFMKRYDERQDAIWTVSQNDHIVAANIIDGSIHGTEQINSVARLRFFIVGDSLRGQGMGRKLMEVAIAFCDEVKFDSVNLKTLVGLDAARHLYKEFGFVVTEQQVTQAYGQTITEEFYERLLPVNRL